MADAILAELPRLVRVGPEVRRRGVVFLGIAASVTAYWLLGWLLDQPLQLARTLFALAVSAPLSLAFAAVIARRRLREGGRNPLPPPRMSVYETRADARQRHARAMSVLLLGVVALLAFDRLTGGGGTMPGLLVGLTAANGAADLVEARRWGKVEVARRLRLFILIPARALLGGFAPSDVYALPGGDDPDFEHRGVPATPTVLPPWEDGR